MSLHLLAQWLELQGIEKESPTIRAERSQLCIDLPMIQEQAFLYHQSVLMPVKKRCEMGSVKILDLQMPIQTA